VTASHASTRGTTPGDEALRRLSPDEFREVIGHFASGVTVITAVHEGSPYGTTASAVTSLSLEPPMVLVCMSKQSETGQAMGAAGRFAVNILSQNQADAAVRFARKGSSKFEGVEVTPGEWGEPLLAQALATLECRVVEEVTGGTHSVFLAEVHRASARGGAPLAYFRGQFGRLELAEGTAPESSPPDLDAAPDALRAAAAIELGVAALCVGRLDAAQLAGARRLAHALTPAGADGRPTALSVWVPALTEFLEYVVSLAGSQTLLDAYRSANVAATLAQGQPGAAPYPDAHRPYVELVDAYEAGDLAQANEAIERRTAQAIEALPRSRSQSAS
jgi:flavin reductase (DIM6/NTAB) family NADH-FMN oxidoreductase RutF